MSSSPIWRFLCCAVLFASCSTVSLAQNTDSKVPPVLDVHVHAMDGNFPGIQPMCPNTSKFTASDPKDKEEPFGWVSEPCTPALYPSAPGEYMKDVVAEMERLNVTAVVFGDPKSVQKWKDAAPAGIVERSKPAAEVVLRDGGLGDAGGVRAAGIARLRPARRDSAERCL